MKRGTNGWGCRGWGALVLAVGVGALGLPAFGQAPKAVETHAARGSDLIPGDVLAAVTLERGGEGLRRLQASDAYKAFLKGKTYGWLSARPGFVQAKMGVLGFAGAAELDPWTMFESVLGENLTVALGPGDGGKPTVLMVSVTDRPDVAQRLAQTINQWTGVEVDGKPDPARSRMVAGVRGYEINKDAYYAVFDNVIAFANRPAALERAIRLRGTTSGRLSDREDYKRARAKAGADCLAWAFVDVAKVRALAGKKWIPEKLPNALASLMFGGITSCAGQAKTATASLHVDAEEVRLNVFLDSGVADSETVQAFFAKPTGDLDWSRLELPRSLGQIVLRRDVSDLWARREALLTPRALSEVSNFANNVTNLLGQMDFGDDFLPQTGGDIRFLASRQVFDGAKPMPELPAFGLLVPIEDVTAFGQRLESAVMMAFSFVSMDAAKNDRPSLMVDIDEYKGHKLICAVFPPAPDTEKTLPQRYNFSPTAAIVKDRFVLGSTKQFIKDVVDASERLEATSTAGLASKQGSSHLTLRVDELAEVLRANLEPLVANKMIEDDVSREQASSEIGMLLKALSIGRELEADVARVPGGIEAYIRLTLKTVDR